MPRISLQSLLASVLTIAVVFALYNNASQLPPPQFWNSLTCSEDGRWLFAVGNETSYLIDLETNEVSSRFDVYGDIFYYSQATAFVDNDTIIAIDSRRRIAPRIVWISISEDKITREMPIPAFTQAAVSGKHFASQSATAAMLDIRDAKTVKSVASWAVPTGSGLVFSHDGNFLSRSNAFAATTRGPTLVFDIQSGKQVASYPNTLSCLVKDDPANPFLIQGLSSGQFRDKEYPSYFRDAKYSIDGTRINTGDAIINSETGNIIVDFNGIRQKLESPDMRVVGMHSVLSADNQKLFVSNQNVDNGISVYDSFSLQHLHDIRVARSRWQVIGIGFLMMVAVAMMWVLIVKSQRRRNAANGLEEVATPPASPPRLRLMWRLMVFGGMVHLALNVFLIHNIPFASLWKRDSQFSAGAYLSAALVVGLSIAGLLIALTIFVKGATSSVSRLRITAVAQMLIDPINTILGITSFAILLKSKQK